MSYKDMVVRQAELEEVMKFAPKNIDELHPVLQQAYHDMKAELDTLNSNLA